jgi:hypothetical protein
LKFNLKIFLAGKSYTDREKEFSDLQASLKKDAFYVAPPGGESLANSCLRVDRMYVYLIFQLDFQLIFFQLEDFFFKLLIFGRISQWQSSCPGQRVIAVCHGNIMMAFRVRLERYKKNISHPPEKKIPRMSSSRYQEIIKSDHTFDKTYNCHILHYTRRDPLTNEIEPIPRWMRSINPWDSKLSRNEWEEISRPVYTNEQLLNEVAKVPQLINSDMVDPKDRKEFKQ